MQFVWTLDSCISSIHVFIQRLIKTTIYPNRFHRLVIGWLQEAPRKYILLLPILGSLDWLRQLCRWHWGPKAPQVGQRSQHGNLKPLDHGTPWSCGKVHPWNPMDSNRKSASQWESNNLTWSWWWGRQLPRSLNTTIAGFFMHSCYIICRSSIVRQMRKQPVGSKLRQRWSVCLHVFTEAGVDHFTIVSLEQWMKFGWQSQMHQYPTANGSRLSPTIIPLFFLQLVAPRWEMQVLPLDSLASTSSCSSCQPWHCFGLALDICWGTADSSLLYNTTTILALMHHENICKHHASQSDLDREVWCTCFTLLFWGPGR